MKLNIDAYLCEDSGSDGMGAIITDDRVLFVATGNCDVLSSIDNAALAETRPLLNSLLLAVQVGCNRIRV